MSTPWPGLLDADGVLPRGMGMDMGPGRTSSAEARRDDSADVRPGKVMVSASSRSTESTRCDDLGAGSSKSSSI